MNKNLLSFLSDFYQDNLYLKLANKVLPYIL